MAGLALAALAWPAAAQDDGTLRHPGQAAVDRAIDAGAAFLRAGWEQEREARQRHGATLAATRAGERALVGYTLLKAGLAHDDPAVAQIVAGLAFEPIEPTYDVACTLLLLEAQDARAHRAWIEELLGRLLEVQNEHGWGYPSGHDLSNTQYGALGLWAAARAGVEVPPEAWRRLSSAVTDYGAKQGGFAYASGGDGGATGSMTAAGVGTLALCEMELARAGALDSSWAWTLQCERARALEWLTPEFRVTANPHGGGWTHYWLYGLERMAAFSGLERLGERDWYGEGAGWLVSTQDDRGAWNERVDTCFAVLFLARAALASLSPATGGEGASSCRSEPDANVRFEVRPAGERAAFRLLGLRRPVAEAFEWPGEARRGPRVLRVEYLAGERVVAVALGDATRTALGRTFPAAGSLEGPATDLRARVHVLVPQGRPGAGRSRRGDPAVMVLESEPLACPALATGAREVALAPRPNLLRAEGARAKAKASSTAHGFDDLPGVEFGADHAVDGRARHPWLAGAKDARPKLSLSLKRALRADTLTLTAARLPGYPADELARPLEVLVTLEDERELRVALSPDPARPTRVDLGEALEVRGLELCILARVPGRRGDVVGLGEVALSLTRGD